MNELSNVTALGSGDDARERLATVETYIPEYLQALVGAGHNILHTIPLAEDWKSLEATGMDAFALTSVQFKVLTNRDVTIPTCQAEEPENVPSPLLVLYGMCRGRDLPFRFFGSWSVGWLPVGPKSVGTIGLSRKIFLERHIVHALGIVNKHTTIVPQSVDVIDGQWDVVLTTWNSHANKKKSSRECAWNDITATLASQEYLTFVWEYCDDWYHQHHGTFADEANGEYSLSCMLASCLDTHGHRSRGFTGATKNTLTVPTFYDSDKVEIKVKGTSTVQIGGKANHEKWRFVTGYNMVVGGFLKSEPTVKRPLRNGPSRSKSRPLTADLLSRSSSRRQASIPKDISLNIWRSIS